MDEFGLDGPAFSLGNRIFIRGSRYDPQQRLVANSRLTDFGHLLVHELTARHLAHRQNVTGVALGQGDVHHWASRATEQQLEQTTLMAHRQNLEDRLREIEEGVRIYRSSPDAPAPVMVEIAEHAFASGLSERMAQRCAEVASWQDVTGVMGTGRSLIIPLEPDEFLHCRGKTFRFLRLKLVTYDKGPPIMETYVEPPDALIQQPTFYLTMDAEGRIHCIEAPPRPKGTDYEKDAANERRMMGEAFWKDFPTGYALGKGRFVTMLFQGRPVGLVIIAEEEVGERRFGYVIHEKAEQASQLPTAQNQIDAFCHAFTLLGRGTRLAAGELRRLHEMGITHANPHHGQWVIHEGGRLRCYDFAEAKSIRDMTRDEFILCVFEDFRSMYSNTYMLSAHGAPETLYKQMMATLGVSPTPIEELMNGYFTPAQRASIGEAHLRQATDPENAIPFLYAFFQTVGPLEGMRLRDIVVLNDLVQIFAEIAGPLYDRLIASDAVLAAEPVPARGVSAEVEAASLRVEIAAVNGELERLREEHRAELARIEARIQTDREAAEERGILPPREDIAMTGERPDASAVPHGYVDVTEGIKGGAQLEPGHIVRIDGEEKVVQEVDDRRVRFVPTLSTQDLARRDFTGGLIDEEEKDTVMGRVQNDEAAVYRVEDSEEIIRDGVRAVFADAGKAGLRESMGRAPKGYIAVNGIMDRAGRIEVFKNVGRLSETAQEKIGAGELYKFTFLIKAKQDGDLERQYCRLNHVEIINGHRPPAIAVQRLSMTAREVNKTVRENAGLEDDERWLIAATVLAMRLEFDKALAVLRQEGPAGDIIDEDMAREYLEARREYRSAKIKSNTRFHEMRTKLGQAILNAREEDIPGEEKDRLIARYFGEDSAMIALGQEKDREALALAKIAEAAGLGRGGITPAEGSPAVFSKLTDEFRSLTEIAEGMGVEPVTLEDDFSILSQARIVERQGQRLDAAYRRHPDVATESLDAAAEYLVYLFAEHRDNVSNYTRNRRMNGRRRLMDALRRKIKEKERIERRDAETMYRADAEVTRDILAHDLVREGSGYSITPNRRRMSDEAIRLLGQMAERIRDERGIQIVVNPPVDDDEADALVFQCTRDGELYGEAHINLHSKEEVREAGLDRTLAVLNIGLAASTVPLDLQNRKDCEDLIGLINRQYALLDMVGGKLIQDNADAAKIREILHEYPIHIILPPVEKHEFQKDWELEEQQRVLEEFA